MKIISGLYWIFRWMRGLEKIKDNDEDNIIIDDKGRRVGPHDEGPEYLDKKEANPTETSKAKDNRE